MISQHTGVVITDITVSTSLIDNHQGMHISANIMQLVPKLGSALKPSTNRYIQTNQKEKYQTKISNQHWRMWTHQQLNLVGVQYSHPVVVNANGKGMIFDQHRIQECKVKEE